MLQELLFVLGGEQRMKSKCNLLFNAGDQNLSSNRVRDRLKGRVPLSLSRLSQPTISVPQHLSALAVPSRVSLVRSLPGHILSGAVQGFCTTESLRTVNLNFLAQEKQF